MRKAHGTQTNLHPDEHWIIFSFETQFQILLIPSKTKKY